MVDNIVLRIKDTINRGHSVMWLDASHLGELYERQIELCEKEKERTEELKDRLRLISVTLSLGSKEAMAEALRIARG